ncbi:antifungal protein ginkbilobin-2 [Brachypodium distachyon]|uniref:Gnk2-homologous domain-containing protein n=1 Tax=Brachypodium distachyon TaxID=15368 RepID=I1GRN4_BRADI|nr:antifungal protein ginkbilobin-2 [Brachypodium distachyon]KQK14894.1 hypothetical protein BRADI_1g19310v3 [Brachypodium distachyon]|eukprot:XP_003559868.1 antifungal protein ginkbilobin-2 [Brachypodium distachyon]
MAASSRTAELIHLLLLPVALLLLFCGPHGAGAAPSTTPLSVLCNGDVYGAGDPFAASLAYVLSDLLARAPSSSPSPRDAYSISPWPNAFAYGHAACGARVPTHAACAACLGSAIAQINSSCGAAAVGARAVLVDCRVRYEQYAFVD